MWTMKDGSRIAIKDMSDSHLWNAIQLLRRKAPGMAMMASLQADSAASMMGGEMAQFCLEQEAANLADMEDTEFLYYHTAYPQLVREAARRKLPGAAELRSELKHL